jgi:hypothetical protein
MANEISAQVGSGNQGFRKDNPGKYHRPGFAVNVINWEDAIAVHEVRSSGYTMFNQATKLPSGVANLDFRRAIAVYNNGPNPIYVGQSGITTSNGYPVPVGTEKAFAMAGNLDLWAIGSGSSPIDVRIFEIA